MNPFRAVASWFGGLFDKRLFHSVGGGRTTTAKEYVNEDSALNYSAVWCATRLICGTAAGLPLPVYRGLNSEYREKDRLHPAFRLLNGSPNPEQTAYNFRSIMWQWQVNWGNAFAEIVREGGEPTAPLLELWPIHPARVQICRDESDFLYYEIKSDRGLKEAELEPWQVLHIPSIITCDGITGHGVISHARESIGAGIAAEKFGAHTLVSGVPRAVVQTTGQWQPDARKAFREEWEEIYGGADKSRIALLQGGATLVPFNFSAEDSQFLQTRQFGVEEIARWYGIPPHMLQHLIHATFNNVEHMGIDFVRYCLVPWLRIWEQCIHQKLLTPNEQAEYFAEHNVDALMRGDAASRSSFYTTMTSAALMTRNEARKLENLPPVDGGDTFLVQGAMVPLDDEGKPVSEFVGGDGSVTTTETDSEDPEVPVATGAAEDVQATALNGAQITSLVSIGDKLVLGDMTIEAGRAMIQASFPVMDRGLIDTIVKELGTLAATKAKEREQQAAQQQQEPDDEGGTEDDPQASGSQDVRAVIAGRVKRILAHDLSRILTKESKALVNHAKKPEKFVSRVDTFYSEHHAIVTDAVTESLSALTECGVSIEAEVFVATWIREGKGAILEAAGIASAMDLPNVIQSVIDSKTWAERPIRAIERVQHANH